MRGAVTAGVFLPLLAAGTVLTVWVPARRDPHRRHLTPAGLRDKARTWAATRRSGWWCAAAVAWVVAGLLARLGFGLLLTAVLTIGVAAKTVGVAGHALSLGAAFLLWHTARLSTSPRGEGPRPPRLPRFCA
ncbi:hypothetical protein GCM10017673_37950 [Streptosporangium violaceochromogenes]|nr:hypothetical protein GCM10017673_37950 [Streptosporangium violaceochromogenes]